MAAIKHLVLLVAALLLLAQVAVASQIRWKRDTQLPTAEEAGKAINELIDGFKANADALLKSIRESDAYKEFSESLSKFGSAVKSERTKLIEKAKTAVDD
ncbi:hypothetical protein PPYR_03380 [Photinus pyralis]|uniref:Uncharacterized protein n=1 Tax=Photinus pyralis TaxID=7054 RepID=A0A5N4A2M1_PHOPY|nr:hypothetical protein PPYR_03380 [Photinus pyralis]